MMVFDDIKQYKALLECNDVGKKLGDKSAYVFTSGMLMFYPYKLHEEFYSDVDYQATIAFLHDDVIDRLDGLEALQLFIEGTKFAAYNKDYGKSFNRMELTNTSLDIIYSIMYTETKEDIFCDWLYAKFPEGRTREDIMASIEEGVITPGILNPVQLIEFTNYNKKYEAKTYEKDIIYSIPLLNKKNSKILKRFEKFKDELLDSDLKGVYEEELDADILAKIVNSTLPYTFKCKLNDTNVRVRVMKNVLKGYVGSKVQSGEYKCIDLGDELYQNIIILRMKKFTISTTFKSFLW